MKCEMCDVHVQRCVVCVLACLPARVGGVTSGGDWKGLCRLYLRPSLFSELFLPRGVAWIVYARRHTFEACEI